MVHFYLTITSTTIVLNSADFQAFHSLFELKHCLLVLLEVDHKVFGSLSFENSTTEILHVVVARGRLLIYQTVDEPQLGFDLSLLIL